MVVSGNMYQADFSRCANGMLYKIYQATVLTYAASNTLHQRANLWRKTCMYVIKTLVMLPHISKTGDTTHKTSFHATASIMLLIHAVLMAGSL
jgi:hypothetical protein